MKIFRILKNKKKNHKSFNDNYNISQKLQQQIYMDHDK